MSSIPQNQDSEGDRPGSRTNDEQPARFVAAVLVAATAATVVLLGIAWLPKPLDLADVRSPADIAADLSTAELIKVRRTSVVCLELLRRPDSDLETLHAALIRLARLQNKTPSEALQKFVLAADSETSVESLRNVTRLCLENEELRSAADALAAGDAGSLSCRVGTAMQISLHGNAQVAFSEAATTPTAQASLLESLPLIHSEEIRSKLYHHIRPILFPDTKDHGADVLPVQELQELAISVMVQLPGNEIKKARDLVQLISEERCKVAAIAGFSTLPTDCWPQGDLGKLAETVIAVIAECPVDQRGSEEIQAAFRLAQTLSEYFPDAQRRRLRKRLAELAAEAASE